MKRVLSMLLVLAMCLALVPGAIAADASVVNLVMFSSPDQFNPYFGDGGLYTIMATHNLIYSCLLRQKPELDGYLPGLAESYEVSDDSLTYTFHLQHNALWHDGVPFTSADVVFTLKAIMDPAWTGTAYVYFSKIEGAAAYKAGEATEVSGLSAPDDYTIILHMSEPYAPLLDYIASNLWILPEHLLKDIPVADMQNCDFSQNPVGTGPYKFVQYATDQYVEYAANPDYYLGAPKIDKLILRIMSADVAITAFEKGELDSTTNQGLGTLPVSDYDTVAAFNNVNVGTFDTLSCQFLAVNVRKPYLSDPRLVEAMAYAIDRQAIVDQLLQGKGTVAWSNIPTFSPYHNTEVDYPTYDLEKAKSLLAEMGWDGSQELVLSVPKGQTVRERMAAIIQQYLIAAGINCTLEYSEFSDIYARTITGEYDMAMFGTGGSVADPNAMLYSYLHSSQIRPVGTNITGYADPQVDELLDAGLRVTDFAARKAIYDELQAYLATHSCWVTIYYEQAVTVTNKRMLNMVSSPIGITWNVNEWEIAQ